MSIKCVTRQKIHYYNIALLCLYGIIISAFILWPESKIWAIFMSHPAFLWIIPIIVNKNFNEMNAMKQTFMVFVAVCFAFNAMAQQPNTYDTHKFLVAFDDTADDTYIASKLAQYNAVELWRSPLSQVIYAETFSFPFTLYGDPVNDIKTSVENLSSEPRVKGTGLDYDVEAFMDPLPPTNGETEPLFCDILLEPASTTSVTVTILDTGLNPEDNSDDYTYSYGDFSGKNYLTGQNADDLSDQAGHGTHVSGIISHVSQHEDFNALTVSDINFDVRKVFDNEGAGRLSNIILGFDEGVMAGSMIVNCSFAYYLADLNLAPGTKEPFQVAIETAEGLGVLVNASASNESHDNDSATAAYPASFDAPNIISVASHSCYATLSSFSNFGETSVDIAALGEELVGPDLNGFDTEKSGTSQANAYLTGVAAMLATHLNQVHYEPIKCAIMNGALSAYQISPYVLSEGVLYTTGALLELNQCSNIGTNGGSGGHNGPVEVRNSNEVPFDAIVSPNPTRDFIKIETIGSNEDVSILIKDISGRVLTKASTSNPIYNLDLSMLQHGTYILEISNGVERVVQKIVKI